MTMTLSLPTKKQNTAQQNMFERNPPQMAEEWRKLDYWDSGEVINLFNPTLSKLSKSVSVTEKNCCRTLSNMLTRLRR
jgi:hypothetical protein